MGTMRLLLAAALFLAPVLPARAADVALVIGNADYAVQPDMPEAARVTDAAVALTRAGWSVITFRDLPADAAEPLLRRLADRLEEADRLVIFLAGRFAHGAGDAWLLAADASAPDMIGVAREGLSLSSLMLLAGQKPGGAVVLLGEAPGAPALGPGLSAGSGGLVAPQGVLLVQGPVAALDALLRERLLQPGMSYATALREAPAGVSATGFVSPLIGLAAGVADAQEAGAAEAALAEAFDEGYWLSVEDAGSAEGYARYLDRFPEGANAATARARLADVRDAPRRAAEAAEAALGLDRESRRAIQQDLALLGHDPRGIDGIFGPATRAAIAAWQRAEGREVTGYVNAAQLDRLAQQAAARNAELEREAERRRAEQQRADRAFWARTGAGGSEAGLRRYLEEFPDGLHADEARARLDAIERAAREEARRDEREAWDRARSADRIPAYMAYLESYPDGRFAGAARARLAELRRETGGERNRLLAQERALGLSPAALRLVEARLQALGLEPGVVDGQFDPRSRRAIRQFQRERALPATGFLDRPTVARLLTGVFVPQRQ